MSNKKLAAIFFVFLYMSTAALTGCQSVNRKDETVPADFNLNGNTTGNSANWGIAAAQGDWIYYQNSGDGNTLYKVKADGADKTKLDDEFIAYGINVVGEWVYYSDYGKIYKIRTDGKDKTILYEGPPNSSYFVSVLDGWVYFNTEEVGEYRLYKMRTDGTEITKIIEDRTACINIIGDWVYYNNLDDYLHLYKIRTDGTGAATVGNIISTCFVIDGEWVYYARDYLYKARLDGTGEEIRLSGGKAGAQGINIDNGWLYFNNIDDGCLYKISVDGTDETKLADETAYDICVIGDWIYYSVLNNDLSVYRIKTDGTGREKVA